MRVISQSGMVDVPYENVAITVDKSNEYLIHGHTAYEDKACLLAKYSSEQHALKALAMLHNAYVGIVKGLNVDISADTAEKIQEMMKTGYGMLIAKENYNGDRLEFYPMNTVFRFPADEELE